MSSEVEKATERFVACLRYVDLLGSMNVADGYADRVRQTAAYNQAKRELEDAKKAMHAAARSAQSEEPTQ